MPAAAGSLTVSTARAHPRLLRRWGQAQPRLIYLFPLWCQNDACTSAVLTYVELTYCTATIFASTYGSYLYETAPSSLFILVHGT